MASSASSLYADPDLYDLAYSEYRDDIDFYVELAKRSRGPVLEAACGTGRVLIPTLQAGVDIDGFDAEPAMVAALQRKTAALGLKAHASTGDMRDFTMPRRYALITIPFRSFMHLHTTEDQLKALRCIREHLESGGALVLNLFHPSFERIVKDEGTQQLVREFSHPETGLMVGVFDTPRYDRVNQLLAVEREVQESDPRGYAGETRRYGFRLRWVYRAEMELLLKGAGFSRWEVTGGFDGRPLEHDTDEMVWTAWKD